MNELVTVFTPTYNRKHLLPRAYEAIKRQTSKNFIWMIVDDGSTDNTDLLVKSWIDENIVKIEYIKKDNGGVGSAYVTAINNCHTELIVAVDSDDFLPDNGIELIEDIWCKNTDPNIAGIVAIDKYLDGRVVGDLLPDVKTINLIDLLTGKYGINNGDRTDVVRTQVYKEAIQSEDYNEKLCFEPHNIHLILSKKYDFIVCNECLKIIEYQDDGLTKTLYKRYVKYAENFVLTRLLYLSLPNTNIKFKVKTYLHLCAECFLCNDLRYIKRVPSKLMFFIMLFPGFLLSLYIKAKAKIM